VPSKKKGRFFLYGVGEDHDWGWEGWAHQGDRERAGKNLMEECFAGIGVAKGDRIIYRGWNGGVETRIWKRLGEG